MTLENLRRKPSPRQEDAISHAVVLLDIKLEANKGLDDIHMKRTKGTTIMRARSQSSDIFVIWRSTFKIYLSKLIQIPRELLSKNNEYEIDQSDARG